MFHVETRQTTSKSLLAPHHFEDCWMTWIQGIWHVKTVFLCQVLSFFSPVFREVWDLNHLSYTVLKGPAIQTSKPLKALPFLCAPSALAGFWQRGGVWHGVLASWVMTTGARAGPWQVTARPHFKWRVVESRAGIHPADLLGYRLI